MNDKMTREEALDIMWAAHVIPYIEPHKAFFYAELNQPATMHEWNGAHPVEENRKVWEAPAGTRVLVTVYSSLGDVGIRARRLDEVGHGYDCRVPPEALDNWERTERKISPEAEKLGKEDSEYWLEANKELKIDPGPPPYQVSRTHSSFLGVKKEDVKDPRFNWKGEE